MDREKKIAEIKARLDVDFYVFSERDNGEIIEYDEAQKDISFLLSELDRLKREIESHGPEGRNYTNRQVVELRMERERLIEENRKLLEERDEARSKAEEAWKEIDSLERLLEERNKLIEVLRWYANPKHWYGDETFCPPEGISTEEDCGQRAREILKEIGVTVE